MAIRRTTCGLVSSLAWMAILCALASVRPAAAQDPAPASEQHLHGEANQHMHQTDFDELVQRFESPGRAEWQRPDTVIAALGDLDGKIVADIGAGTGYFAFPVAEQASRVIAIDIDQRMLDYIEQRKRHDKTGTNIETRLAIPDHPKLAQEEADAILIVNTYHHIEERDVYLEHIVDGLKPDGQLTIVEFHKKELPVGPPPAMKLEPKQVQDELAAAGFADITVNTGTLPYQYVVQARRR